MTENVITENVANEPPASGQGETQPQNSRFEITKSDPKSQQAPSATESRDPLPKEQAQDNGKPEPKLPSDKPIKKVSGAEKDWGKLTYKMREAERQRDELKARLEALEKSSKPQEKTFARENFKSDAEYTQHMVSEALKAERAKWEQEHAENLKIESQRNEFTKSWDSRIKENYKSDAELQEYVNDVTNFIETTGISDMNEVFDPETISYFEKSKYGPALVHEFVKLGAEQIERYNQMHPFDKGDFLRRATAYIATKNSASPKPQSVPNQQPANWQKPAPIGRVGQGAGTKSPHEMTQQERIEMHRKGL